MSCPMKSQSDDNSIHLCYENAAFTATCSGDEDACDIRNDLHQLQYSPNQNRTKYVLSDKNYGDAGENVNRENCHEISPKKDELGFSQKKKNPLDGSISKITDRKRQLSGQKQVKAKKTSLLMSYVKEKLLSNGRPEGNDAHCMEKAESDKADPGGRETWGKKVDFLLSIIGFAVDLGNVWRFPYICYKNGGGAFLVPYLLMLIFLGLPLFYMELALGQFQRCGAISVWNRICPMFTGVGYGICIVATVVGMYYNTVIAWSVFYMFASFRSEVPWAHCNNDWNTEHCLSLADGYNNSFVTNNSMSASAEYYLFEVLGIQHVNGIESIGKPRWQLLLCLLGVFVIVYFSLWKGIKSSGKAVWITATVPYIVLLILLVRGCTLPGADLGIKYYVTPVWERLLDEQVWLDAASQIFFSLGPGFGTLLALSSYNNFHNNCYFDAIAVSIINCMTSFLAGFVVFAVLGYMAVSQGRGVDQIATDGPGLVFVVYPEVIATLGGAVFWSIIFFLMLITLGLDSTFGGLEAVITGFCDAFPIIKRRRELFVLGVVCYCFIGSIPSVTDGGQYVIMLLDTHAAPISLLLICFVEAIAVNWFYGVQNFSNDVESMLGHQPGIFWKICWVGICPVCLLVLFILACWKYAGMTLMGYVYPPWAVALGWCVTSSSLICIPAYMVYKLLVTPGAFKQKLLRMVRPGTLPQHVLTNGHLQTKDIYDLSNVVVINSTTNERNIILKNANKINERNPDTL